MGNAMRVLITGGAGFIGRRTAKVLADHGFAVTILDSRIAARRDLLESLTRQVNCVEGDIKDRELVSDTVRNKDAIIHLAAGCSFLMYEERPVIETVNVIHGFLNVLEAAREHRISRLVYASTSAVYEGNALPYREDMILRPPDHKALAKKAIEEFARLYSERYGLRTVAVRPFSVYGDGEIDKQGFANVTSLFVWAMLAGHSPVIWGDGTQTRDFIFVDDLADIIRRCMIQDIDEQAVNAGTGVETSFNEIVDIINEHLDASLEPCYVPVPVSVYARRLQADISRQQRLGLLASTDVRTGIARIIEYSRRVEEPLRSRLAEAQWRYTPSERRGETKASGASLDASS